MSLGKASASVDGVRRFSVRIEHRIDRETLAAVVALDFYPRPHQTDGEPKVTKAEVEKWLRSHLEMNPHTLEYWADEFGNHQVDKVLAWSLAHVDRLWPELTDGGAE